MTKTLSGRPLQTVPKGNYQLRIEEKDVKGTLKRVYKIRRMSNVAYSKASWIDVDVTSVMSG